MSSYDDITALEEALKLGADNQQIGKAFASGYGSLELTAEEARRLCQYSLDIVCITDFTGQVLWSNQAECAILGYSREEMSTLTWFDLTHPDDIATVAEGLKDVAIGKLHPCTEVRLRCKDGSYKWISWSGVPLFAERKVYSIGRDISAQRNAESQVRNLAAIVKASNEAIFSIDRAGLISSWNTGAEQLYGYHAGEILKQPLSLLLACGTAPNLASINQGSHDSGSPDAIEEQHKCKNGRKISVSVSYFAVPDESGGLISAAIVRDITLRKEAERSIADFYSITSHELRTPLSSVRGVLSLLENGLVDPASGDGHDLIKMARSSCDRLVRLVNDILDLRRIESGSVQLNFEPVSSQDLLDSSLADITGIAGEAGVEIKLEILAQGMVFGDKDRLAQVLTNLLSNAIKYSEPKTTVVVRINKESEDILRFSVIDNGPGIDEAEIPKLFKKFGQLDSSDTRPKEGIGLGLFVAHSIIEQHKGQIGVYSPDNKGCHFWFDLTLAG